MTHYTYAQLEQLWIQAGGAPSMAALMAAIAEAESSGNSDATGGVGEKGLWQINPAAWGSLATYDPLGNAKAAVYVLQHQGLSAWSTYNHGDYKKYLQGNVPPGTGTLPGGGSSGGGGSGGGSATLTSSGGNIFNSFANGFLGQLIGLPPNAQGDPLQALVAMADDFEQFFKWISWLFNPSHWLRVGAFVVGVLSFAGAGYMIKEAL